MMKSDLHIRIIANDDARIEFAKVSDSDLSVMRVFIDRDMLFALYLPGMDMVKNVHAALTAYIAANDPPRSVSNVIPAKPEDPEPPAAA